jgi:hypothetical protein
MRVLIVCLTVVVLAGVAARAQSGRGELVEVDPIRCWWRTSDGAVSVGQPFSVVLTCAVLENDSVRVVPDESPLAVGTVQLSPFELLGGSHPADLRSGQRRFFQYDYTVRIIDPAVIGKDVPLPALVIHYRVESRLQAQALEGRDRMYVLPPQAVHILSTVPADADDIRDAADAPFGVVESTRFRARMFDIASLALGALGIILLVPAVVRAMGLTRARTRARSSGVSDRVVLGRAVSALTAAQHEGRGGWTPELLARALAATRIVAAYALGRRASQQVVTAGSNTSDDRLPVTVGFLRKHHASVASAATTEDLSRAIDQLPARASANRRALLGQLRDAMRTLTRGQYAAEALNDDAIDEAVRAALDAAREVRGEHGWLRTSMARVVPRR